MFPIRFFFFPLEVLSEMKPSTNLSALLPLQGLYDNFLNMKVKDSGLGSVGLALEWLSFVDLVNNAVMHGQNFQLMRYLPFLPVSFHLLFAASSIPRLAYPHSQQEVMHSEAIGAELDLSYS